MQISRLERRTPAARHAPAIIATACTLAVYSFAGCGSSPSPTRASEPTAEPAAAPASPSIDRLTLVGRWVVSGVEVDRGADRSFLGAWTLDRDRTRDRARELAREAGAVDATEEQLDAMAERMDAFLDEVEMDLELEEDGGRMTIDLPTAPAADRRLTWVQRDDGRVTLAVAGEELVASFAPDGMLLLGLAELGVEFVLGPTGQTVIQRIGAGAVESPAGEIEFAAASVDTFQLVLEVDAERESLAGTWSIEGGSPVLTAVGPMAEVSEHEAEYRDDGTLVVRIGPNASVVFSRG